MPNHVRNIITIEGAPGEKKKFFETYFSSDDEGKPYFDFNKVIPEPEGIGIEIHSGIENMIKNALKLPTHSNPLIAELEAMNRAWTPGPQTLTPEEYKLFEQGLKNYREHGYIYWYDWRCDMWGTKWGAYSNERLSDSSFQFDTAWSHPEPIMVELSKQMPSLIFNAKYADEDTGSNVGRVRYEAGTFSAQDIENLSKEAYDLAFEIRPDRRENYRWNESSGKYEWFDSEEEEEV